MFGPLVFLTMAPLHYAAKFDPFLSLDCVPTPAPGPPPWRNLRKGRDQILSSGNPATRTLGEDLRRASISTTPETRSIRSENAHGE